MPSMKKVAGPGDVVPVTLGPTRYEALHWGKTQGFAQNGGHVVAVDVASGQVLWTAELYKIHYRPEMEADKQDCFITALEYDSRSSKLVAQNDRGRRFALDLFSRQAEPL